MMRLNACSVKYPATSQRFAARSDEMTRLEMLLADLLKGAHGSDEAPPEQWFDEEFARAMTVDEVDTSAFKRARLEEAERRARANERS